MATKTIKSKKIPFFYQCELRARYELFLMHREFIKSKIRSAAKESRKEIQF